MHKFGLAAGFAVLSSSSVGAPAAETVSYTYDAKGRVVQVTHSGSVNNGLQANYTHDATDNRTHVTVSGARTGSR